MSAQRLRRTLSLLALALAPSATGCGAGDSGGAPRAQEHGNSAVADAPASAFAPTREPAQLAAFDEQARADLAADVLRRTEAARRTYGDDVPLRVESGLFVLIGAERGVDFDGAADLAQRAVDVYLGSIFARRPDRAVSVYIVKSAAKFIELCDARFESGCEGDLGAYSRKTRDIIVNVGPGLPTITHELAHPLLQTDFPRIPAWFEEGIASLFEKPVFSPPGEIHGAKNWRYGRLVAGLSSPARRRVLHVPAFFSLADEDLDHADQDALYAGLRTFCEGSCGRCTALGGTGLRRIRGGRRAS
jgi:hypothetical protein